ncbi:hypothetical protein [Thiohalorhabdus methylotrophus]|uniref:DUF3467 domain-containing protein n=1 Tax=Thiohalorhabdus methylotrophus TaxID=3242694 RepID=A0ABV4TUE9_9GAMM
MAEKSEEAQQEEQDGGVQVHVPPDLDYVYRDAFEVFVGRGDVVLELANHHRGMPGHVTIGNRIVLSIPNAYHLQQKLQQALHEAQLQLQQSLQAQQQAQGQGSGTGGYGT